MSSRTLGRVCAWVSIVALLAEGGARGQPAPPDEGDVPSADEEAAPGGEAPAEAPPPEAAPAPAPAAPIATVEPAPPLREPEPVVEMPEVLSAPSARLLPAGVVYSRSGIDTSGGVSSDLRVGLGDVAAFGVSITDQVRARSTPDATPRRIYPYVTAIFDMGIAEDRLFRHQPALVLGFRKSFEAESSGRRTRIAELHLVATKRLGRRAELHAGGVFWDASVKDDVMTANLHDRGAIHQLRAFGGIGLRPLDDSEILLDVFWEPEFCYECGERPVDLRPLFSWGVRYHAADWLNLESGVRVPDIADTNLLDAQIFGALSFVNTRLHHLVRHGR